MYGHCRCFRDIHVYNGFNLSLKGLLSDIIRSCHISLNLDDSMNTTLPGRWQSHYIIVIVSYIIPTYVNYNKLRANNNNIEMYRYNIDYLLPTC